MDQALVHATSLRIRLLHQFLFIVELFGLVTAQLAALSVTKKVIDILK
jgi:hypothetical protein